MIYNSFKNWLISFIYSWFWFLVKKNSPKKKRESPIKHPQRKKSKNNQNILVPWNDKNDSNDLYPLSNPIPPLGITVPTIPEEKEDNKNKKVKKKKSTSRSNVNSANNTPKTQRKKRTPKKKHNTEIVITLNKFEEDIDADIIIDFDDESTTSDIKTSSEESALPDDEVYDELKALLKTLGFAGQEWLKKVTIPPTKCFELNENEVLDFEKEANR